MSHHIFISKHSRANFAIFKSFIAKKLILKHNANLGWKASGLTRQRSVQSQKHLHFGSRWSRKNHSSGCSSRQQWFHFPKVRIFTWNRCQNEQFHIKFPWFFKVGWTITLLGFKTRWTRTWNHYEKFGCNISSWRPRY